MNNSNIFRSRKRLINLAVVLCVILLGIIGLSLASPGSARADAGGVPTLTPTPKPPTVTSLPTVAPTLTFTTIPTLQGFGIASTANVAPLLNLATTQAALATPQLAPTGGLRSTPALLCAAFAIVLILIIIIVALWLLGRSTPGPGLPTEVPPGY